jgi:hypothetical protein
MSMLDISSIDAIVKTLDDIKKQNLGVHLLRADRNTVAIVRCAQRLKQCVDSFAVGSLLAVMRIRNS